MDCKILAKKIFFSCETSSSKINQGIIKFIVTLCILTFSCLVFSKFLFDQDKYYITADGHLLFSMAYAIDSNVCNDRFTTRSNSKLTAQLRDNKKLMNHEILQLPKQISGSVSEYCSSPVSNVINNENTLMWMYYSFLKLLPKATLYDLMLFSIVLKLSMIFLFLYCLARANFSYLSIFMTSLIIIYTYIQTTMLIESNLAVYGYILPFCLGFIGLLGLLFGAKVQLKKISLFIACLLIGSYAFFMINLRSSYTPIVALCIINFLIAAFLNLKSKFNINIAVTRVILSAAIILALIFALNYKLQTKLENQVNLNYHVVFHPLVLGLAIPQNDFAKNQGIIWDDSIGTKLARTINPSVSYLDANYEKTMYLFYKKLWINNPGEMLYVYYLKIKLAGTQIIDNYKSHALHYYHKHRIFILALMFLFPLSFVKSGITIFAYYLAIFYIYTLLYKFRKITKDLLFTIGNFLIFSGLLLLESTIIMPAFVPNYHSYLYFSILFTCLLMWHAILLGLANINFKSAFNLTKEQIKRLSNFSRKCFLPTRGNVKRNEA